MKSATNLCCRMALLLIVVLTLPTSRSAGQGTAKNKQWLVHYMPWFQSKATSGNWGWHWTMNHCDPDQQDIAAHYHPLIGPYDSGDPDAIECHALLMKLSGIDGVIIDWYGIESHFDYRVIHENSKKLVDAIKKASMKFAVCYEDQTLAELVKAKKIDVNGVAAHGQKVMRWLDENWMSDPAYLRIEDRPILLVFGPRYLTASQLREMTKVAKTRPRVFALPHLQTKSNADGVFGWPPVSGGQQVDQSVWQKYLDELYTRGSKESIGVVFPRYHDFYAEAKLHKSYGRILGHNGRTFEQSLATARNSDAAVIQIATWNDFGEGTAIEPSTEDQYRYLEMFQKTIGSSSDVDAEALRLPVKLYRLRKKYTGNQQAIAALDLAAAQLSQGKIERARLTLQELDKR